MRIYLDNAATSFPKRPGVSEAILRYSTECGAPVGRGAYREAMEVQRAVDQCRRQAASLFGASSPERMIFTFNGTDALNLAILGICRPGDHVVSSVLEHNSVLRPLRFLSDQRGLTATYLTPQSDGRVSPSDVRRALRPETRLVVITHASNVTGTIQPIADIAEVVRDSSAIFLVDAAQTAGHLPTNVTECGIDLLAAPGHKGLGGPLGTGLLYVRPGLESELTPLRFGGTGSHSEQDEQPLELPDRYESGNHNAIGLVGLNAALEHLSSFDCLSQRSTENRLTAQLIEEFRSIPSVKVHVPGPLSQQLGVVSLSVPGYEPQILASLLDQEFGVQTRAGLHCAPKAHQWLGTFDAGGTVRFSLGFTTTSAEISLAANAVREILGA